MRIAFTAVVMLCAMAGPSAVAQDHASHHATTTPATASARRWATEAPVRRGMAEIRAAVDALEHDAHGQPGPGQAATLAARVEAQVAYLVANCKLEPQADAALHAIIARLLQGAAAIKADPTDMEAVATMRQALQDYPRQFDDPGWAAEGAQEP